MHGSLQVLIWSHWHYSGSDLLHWAGQGLEGRFKMDQICFTSTFHGDHCQIKLDQNGLCFALGTLVWSLSGFSKLGRQRQEESWQTPGDQISWSHDIMILMFPVVCRRVDFFNHNWMEGFQSWLESHPAKHAAGNITVMTCAWTRLLAQKY